MSNQEQKFVRKPNSPGRPIKGLMLDSARLLERHEFYFELLPKLAQWGYNTLWWHFCDDEGCALKLDCQPELATPYALSKARTRQFVRAAADVGIDVVPEVETLGHALWITRHERYAHLFNGEPVGHNAVCPSHPDTLKLMTEIVGEVADLFPSAYFHAGLDESDLAGCRRCERRGRGKPPWWVHSQYVLSIHQLLRGLGKRMVMWADAVEKHPDLLGVLPHDMVLAHWHYRDVPAEKILPSVRAGFDVICVPALGGMILQPDAAVFENVDDMTRLVKRLPTEHSLGMVASWWESGRNLRDTYPLAAAYAGASMRDWRPAGGEAFARQFCGEYFGLRDKATVGAIWQAHAIVPMRQEMRDLYPRSMANMAAALKLAQGARLGERMEAAERCVEALEAGRRRVARNRPAFDATLLAARISLTAWRNGQRLAEALKAFTVASDCVDVRQPREVTLRYLTQALNLLAQSRDETESMRRAAAAEWDRTRYPRDAKKDGSSPLLRQRRANLILSVLTRSSRFQQTFVTAFQRAVNRYQRGGPLPGGL